MQNEDRDWLEDRMAMNNYIPDDGFTARVVERLPKTRSQPMASLRWRILFVSAFLAFCLIVVQIVPLVSGLDQLGWHYSFAPSLGPVLGSWVRQPTVILGGAGCVVLLAFASIPFLRRWV
jgi:hypothetical protein